MNVSSSRLMVGQFGAPYGVKGWIKFTSFTQVPEAIFTYQPWYISDEPGEQAVPILEWRAYKHRFVVKLNDIDSCEAAQTLTQRQIFVDNERLPALTDNEYYWRDLVGCLVTTLAGDSLGRVDHLLDIGVHDVLVIKPDLGEQTACSERLIPFLMGQTVTAVCLKERVITVDWGLDY